jgi:hypothetical protein
MMAASFRNFFSAPVRAATISGGILSFAAFNQQWVSLSVQNGTKNIAKLLAKNSASPMARQASLM